MGSSSSTNLPPRQYVGDWSDKKSTFLIIRPDGSIIYKKQGWGTTTTVNGRGFFDEFGFRIGKSYSPKLQGFFMGGGGNAFKPSFAVDGVVLRKQRPGSIKLSSTAFLTTAGGMSGGGGPIIDVQAGGI